MSMPRGGRNGMKGGPRPKAKKGTLPRLLKMLFSLNKGYLIATGVCLFLASITGVANSVFLQHILTLINEGVQNGLDAVWSSLLTLFIIMGTVYATCLICNFLQTRLMAVITQKFAVFHHLIPVIPQAGVGGSAGAELHI